MPRSGTVDYQGFNPSPSGVPETGAGNDYLNVHATPEDFGGQIGQAAESLGKNVQQVGAEGQQVATQFAEMATQAKVNDDYANKYAPAAADLRQKFDMLRGQDKVAGYDDYIGGLQNLNKNFTGAYDNNPMGKHLMGGLIDRHVAGEIDGAKRELVQSQKDFSDQSTYSMIKANNDYAAQNYNNIPLVNDVAARNDNHILLQAIHNGHDPNDPQSAALIEEQQKQVKGDMAHDMIYRATSAGDVNSANQIRADMTPVIPGYKQIAIDNFLHGENMRQTGVQATQALVNGQPLPPVVGAPPSQVQAMVANTAQTSGVDPNAALTVLRIESSNGQNLGTRGTIGQDKESAGKPLDAQSQALCDNLKKAGDQATTALGRPTEGWENYAVYQQGAGGGVALLKAMQNNPNAKAVDVLEPLYPDAKQAFDAVTKNGGNATMSVSDFLGHIKQLYTDNGTRANCDFNGTQNPGDAITAQHQQSGATVQPGASPMQSQLNFESKAPDILERINAIPNTEVRAGVMKQFQAERQKHNESATAYKNVLVNQAGQLGVNPNFTSSDQIPPEMRAALTTDAPQTLTYLEKRAEDNAKKGAGEITKDQKEYGGGFKDALNDVWDGKVTSKDQLHDYVANDKITMAGYDRLEKELVTPKEDPVKKASEQNMQKAAFNTIELQITHGMKSNPTAQNKWASTLPALYQAIDERNARKVPPGQYYDPNNKEFIGNDVKALQMPKPLAVGAQIKANQNAVKSRTLGDILGEAQKTNDPAKQAALRDEAIKLGFYDPGAPQVPMSQ